MALTANINLVVPNLPDNDVAFANNAAWVNYWANINIAVSFNSAANTLYVENAYDNNLASVSFNYQEVLYELPTKAQFDSLLLAYQTLNANYKALRNEMKAAGFITNSQ